MSVSIKQDLREPGSLLHVSASTDYSREWRVYAWRRGLALMLLFGWIPVSVGGFLLSQTVLHLPLLLISMILIWGLVMCWAIWYAGEFRCPRCRRRFAALGPRKRPDIWQGLFDKICFNCKLRKFEHG